MLKSLRDKMSELFSGDGTPSPITENSSLSDVAKQYPHVGQFTERRYGVKIDPGDMFLALKVFVERHSLPPPQIFFMEVQMSHRAHGVNAVSANDAKKMLETNPAISLLDVREDWERDIATIHLSKPLTPELLDQILREWDRDRPIVVYCHFGVRSLDAATFLHDRGFQNVYTIQGGIDAWSQEIDSSLKRYDQAYC